MKVPAAAQSTISVDTIEDKIAVRKVGLTTEITYYSIEEADRVRRGIDKIMRTRQVDPNNFEFTVGDKFFFRMKDGELEVNGVEYEADAADDLYTLVRAYIGVL